MPQRIGESPVCSIMGRPVSVNQAEKPGDQNEKEISLMCMTGIRTNTITGRKRLHKAAAVLCSTAYLAASAAPMTVCAANAGMSTITQPLENLKTLVIAVIGAVGIIILAKNVMEFAQAYQQQDSSSMNSALKGIVAGVMMAGISTVLTFLGF